MVRHHQAADSADHRRDGPGPCRLGRSRGGVHRSWVAVMSVRQSIEPCFSEGGRDLCDFGWVRNANSKNCWLRVSGKSTVIGFPVASQSLFIARDHSQRMDMRRHSLTSIHRWELSDVHGHSHMVGMTPDDHPCRSRIGRSPNGQRRNNAKADSPSHHQSSVATQG